MAKEKYYTIKQAALIYEKVQEALKVDFNYVQKLYNNGLKLSNSWSDEYSIAETLNKAAYLHQADEEFIDSLPEKTGKSMVELHKKYTDDLIKALDLSDEDKVYFVKLLAQSNDAHRVNWTLADLVPAAKQNMKMTAALLELQEKYGGLNWSYKDITKSVFSDYKNKAAIYRLIKVFDEHVVDEKNYKYLLNAIKNFKFDDKEKTIELVLETAKDNQSNMNEVLYKNDLAIMANYNKEAYREQMSKKAEEEKKWGQDVRRKEAEEEEFNRKFDDRYREKERQKRIEADRLWREKYERDYYHY